MENYKRIAIAGPSGVGKTTLAKAISQFMGIQYVSGSLYDLMPNLPKNHYDLNAKFDLSQKHLRNIQILNLRKKQYKLTRGNFVTDRSIYDTIGYDIQENSIGMANCDTEDMFRIANSIQRELEDKRITHLIVIPFNRDYLENWVMEEDNKRSTNQYFQSLVSYCQCLVLERIGIRAPFFQRIANLFRKNPRLRLTEHNTDWCASLGPNQEVTEDYVKVLSLNERDHEKRMRVILKFLRS